MEDERKPEGLQGLGRLPELVGVLPANIRPTVLNFLEGVVKNVIAENTRTSVDEDTYAVSTTIVVPANHEQSYKDMFEKALKEGALNVHRFRRDR